MPMPSITSQIVVIRTCIIDDFILRAISQGVDVIMNLGAGLDTRPYRMDLPESLLWIEVDYPRVIEFKDERLAAQQPRCKLERVPLDLANQPERRKLLEATNARAKKLLILTEGVVSYLSVEDVASLADDLRALDRVEGWIVEYFSSELANFRGAGADASAGKCKTPHSNSRRQTGSPFSRATPGSPSASSIWRKKPIALAARSSCPASSAR